MENYNWPSEFDLPTDLKQFVEDAQVSLLKREVGITLLNDVYRKMGTAKYLTGAGGYGKSTILFEIVSVLIGNSDFCVLYIPELHSVLAQAALDKEEAARCLLASLKKQADLQCFPFDLEACDDAVSSLKSLIARVMGRNDMVLVVDQWNAAFMDMEDDAMGKLFRGILNTTRGNVICAVSASFVFGSLRTVMPDASRQCKVEQVDKLTTEEASQLICHFQEVKKAPKPTAESIASIHAATSGIPRLIRFIMKCDLSTAGWKSDLESKALAYYEDCILKRVDGNEAEGQFAKVLLQSYLGTVTQMADNGWGLFRQDEGLMVPVSPFVVLAARRRLHEKQQLIWLAKTLPGDCKGYMLELYIVHCLTCMKDSGAVLKINEISFGCITKIRKSIPSEVLDSNFVLEEGDAVVICGKFPVIDVVIFGNGNLAFVQISMTPYSKHTSKYEHLFKRGLSGGPKNKSLFNHFCEKANKYGKGYQCSRAAPYRFKGLQSDTLFVYVHGGAPYTPTFHCDDKVQFFSRIDIPNIFKGELAIDEVVPLE